MVRIGLDFTAYLFETGVKAIELAWTAASLSLRDQADDVSRQMREYERRLQDGGDPIGEWDGPDRLWDQEDVLRLELLALEEAEQELARAIAISLYHHWERFVPNPDDVSNRKHAQLKDDLKKASIGIHEDIDALWLSANYLKHGNPNRLKRLQERFAEKLPQPSTPSPDSIAWFFEIVRASKRPISVNS